MRALLTVLLVGCVEGREPTETVCPDPVTLGELYACRVQDPQGNPIQVVHTCGPLGKFEVPRDRVQANFPGMIIICASINIGCIYEEYGARQDPGVDRGGSTQTTR